MDMRKKHRKQTFWQVWFPLAITILIFLFLAVFVVILTAGDQTGNFNTKWASISLVYLSIPALISALIILVLLIATIYLAGKLYIILPEYSLKALDFLKKVSSALRMASDRISMPIIFVNSRMTALSVLFRRKSESK